MRDKKVQFIVEAAAIAAIYVVLTVVFSAISFGEVQLRFSEAFLRSRTKLPSPPVSKAFLLL